MGVKVGLMLAAETLLFAALLFGAAGTLAWPAAWAYLVLFFGCGYWLTLRLARDDPSLLAERMKMPMQRGQPVWDKVLIPALGTVWCAWMILMGLDAGRYHWSAMPFWLQCAGAALIALSYVVIDRVFHANTFLAAVVRIQAERGHRVVTTGPYAVVRHPLYATMLVFLPANALLLGSWYGVAGALALLGAVVFRTAMEDRELLRSLDGYAAYAARVRYRLVPYVW